LGTGLHTLTNCESLQESDNLPDPGVLAQEIVDDLEAALEQFREIAVDLGGEKRSNEISENIGDQIAFVLSRNSSVTPSDAPSATTCL